MSEAQPGLGRPGGLTVAPGVTIPLHELTWRFSASSGPGGQHVNTSNTRAEVRFDVAGSPSLPAWARDQLMARLGPVVAIAAGDDRSQARNRAAAIDRLRRRLARALETEPDRTPTRPTRASQRRRLDAKHRQGSRKRERRFQARPDED